MNNGRDPTEKRAAGDAPMAAWVVFQAQDLAQLVELLRQGLPRIPGQAQPDPPEAPAVPLQRHLEDRWLRHTEAAEYLGVSKGTLYQYACQQKIECRKLGGRLQYRRSTLDQFKDQQIRPAHRWLSQRSIIPAALGSGK